MCVCGLSRLYEASSRRLYIVRLRIRYGSAMTAYLRRETIHIIGTIIIYNLIHKRASVRVFRNSISTAQLNIILQTLIQSAIYVFYFY